MRGAEAIVPRTIEMAMVSGFIPNCNCYRINKTREFLFSSKLCNMCSHKGNKTGRAITYRLSDTTNLQTVGKDT